MKSGKGIVWELVAFISNILSMARKKSDYQFSVLSRFESVNSHLFCTTGIRYFS